MTKFLNKKYAVIVLSVLILAGAALMAYGFAPVLSVEGRSISYARFLKVYGAFQRYDQVAYKDHASKAELKRLALSHIVENILLDLIIKETDPGLFLKAEEMLNKAVLANPGLALDKIADKLYGLSASDFKKLVLLTQTKQQALEEHYGANSVQLQAKWDYWQRNAKVKIYYPGYYWEGGEIKIKK